MTSDLEAEHTRLLEEHRALAAERARLVERPDDRAAHIANLARLQDHTIRLRDFLTRTHARPTPGLAHHPH